MKVKPNDLEVEKCILASVLLESSAITATAALITTPEIFYHQRHANLWSAILELYHANEPIDLITITSKAAHNQNLGFESKAQLTGFLVEIQNLIGSAANVEQWCLILKEMYIKRSLIEICQKTALEAYNAGEDAIGCYDGLLNSLNALNSNISMVKEESFSDIMDSVVLTMKEAGASKSYSTGLKTSIEELDRVTSGLQKSDLIIIAARPAMGKTALAIHIGKQQAKFLQKPIAIFSLEMGKHQLAQRILSSDSMVKLENVRHGGMQREQWQKIDSHHIMLRELPMHIYDNVFTINEICATAKNLKLKYGIEEVIIDYLQLITNPAAKKNSNREQELSAISRQLKILAKQLNIPVVALSQLSRAVESRTDKRPMLSDLRETGAIEQDADMVIFPYRDAYYNDNADDPDKCELIIAKHRNGPTGTVECYFYPDYQVFTNHKLTDTNPF